MVTYTHFIDGKASALTSNEKGAVFNPDTGEQLGEVPYASKEDVDTAIASACKAFPEWSATPPTMRGKIMQKWHLLIEKHMDKLAQIISLEHGKSITESKGSIIRGLAVLEFASHISFHLKGTFSQNIARGIDCYDVRQPLGVCAGITPFNFPVMIPLWSGSIALATGNCYLLKPSEKNPGASLILAELALEAGVPASVFNVLQGARTAVQSILDHPDVKAISFVGQTATAKYIYETGAKNGKRVQAFGGAKNHMIVMPDADVEQVADALVGAAYGSAGERCMAVPVVVFVGDEIADKAIERLLPKINALKVGSFKDSTSEMGPLITKDHLNNVVRFIESGVHEKAHLLIDGRIHKVTKENRGYYLGPSLFDRVAPHMEIYKQEIFGPVLCCMRVNSYEEALSLATVHAYGNGVSIFTRDGDTARDFAERIQVGMVGINVPIPIPMGTHSFGGWKNSMFGDTAMHGTEGVRFFTKLKTVTTRWPSGIRSGINFSLPTAEDNEK